MNIYISNLSSIIRSEDLIQLFSPYGKVKSGHIVNDIISGESRGFGYVEMEDNADAQKAIKALDQMEIDTLPVCVQEN